MSKTKNTQRTLQEQISEFQKNGQLPDPGINGAKPEEAFSDIDPMMEKEKLKRRHNEQLGMCIAMNVDIKSNFELFSYRIKSPEQFIDDTLELCQILLENINEIK